MSTAKRKRTIPSVKDKQAIIHRLGKGEKAADLITGYEENRQQISDTQKSWDKIMTLVDNMKSDEGLKRKYLKFAHNEQLDQVLYVWFIQQRTAGAPISAPILQEKAPNYSVLSLPH